MLLIQAIVKSNGELNGISTATLLRQNKSTDLRIVLSIDLRRSVYFSFYLLLQCHSANQHSIGIR